MSFIIWLRLLVCSKSMHCCHEVLKELIFCLLCQLILYGTQKSGYVQFDFLWLSFNVTQDTLLLLFFPSNNKRTHEKILISFITFMKKVIQNGNEISRELISIFFQFFCLYSSKKRDGNRLNIEDYKLDRSTTKPKKRICTKDYVKYQKIWFM